jgi:hypothetical protein
LAMFAAIMDHARRRLKLIRMATAHAHASGSKLTIESL